MAPALHSSRPSIAPNAALGSGVPSSVLRSYYREVEPHLADWESIPTPIGLDTRQVRTILDLGAGSGQFWAALRRTFNANLIAVDPDPALLRVGKDERFDPTVCLLQGRAEAIPLCSASVDLVWASMSLHHVSDLRLAMAEVARVLVPGGWLIVRGTFAGRLDDVALYRYFPAARVIDEGRLPGVAEFANASQRLRMVELKGVKQRAAYSERDYYKRLSQRPFSVLREVADKDYDASLKKMAADLSKTMDSVVWETVDVATFRRVGAWWSDESRTATKVSPISTK